jgi:hypothetical protein
MENNSKANRENLNDISKDLRKQSNRMNLYGIILLIFAFLITYVLFEYLKSATTDLLNRLSTMNDSMLSKNKEHSFGDLNSLIIFLSIRTLIFGSVGGLIIFFVLKMSKSCFDQSTRFLKRMHAAKFFDFISDDESNLDAKLKAFYIWNLNIESAFSEKSLEKSDTFTLWKLFGNELKKDSSK